MDITNATALVTGANRGLGREFTRQLLARGARRVYATARDPKGIDVPGATPLYLDVTDEASVLAAADIATDVDLVVNNAGISTHTDLVTGDLDLARAEMEVHFWGALRVTRAFAPALARAGGGAVVNVLSTLSFRSYPGNGSYAAAKAAEWSLTHSTRLALTAQGTQVLGAHLSSTDTDMMAAYDVPKNDPVDVVRAILDGVQAGVSEVLVDEDSRQAKRLLSASPEELHAAVAG